MKPVETSGNVAIASGFGAAISAGQPSPNLKTIVLNRDGKKYQYSIMG